VLADKRVSFDLKDAPLLEALESVAKELSFRLEVAEDLKPELEGALINLSVSNLEAASAIDLLLKLAGPEYEFAEEDGVVEVRRR
jgi:hypothetical protein